MTEAEWFASVDTQAMISAVRSKGSERIWRLFAVACVRNIEERMRDSRSRQALELAERFADGAATREEFVVARFHAEAAAVQAHRDEWEDEARANFRIDAAYQATYAAMEAADAALACLAENFDIGLIDQGWLLPDLLREIFGNPFQWKEIDPVWVAWNDGTVRRIAEGIYAERAFDRMPILADALLDAGCDDEELLAHCRAAGPHVRGCWALDLILGKS